MTIPVQIAALLGKDLLLEFRRKELLFLALGLSAMLSAAAGLTIKAAFLTETSELALFPGLCWLIFLFSVTLSVARCYEHDLEYRALDALLISGVSTAAIYLAKLLNNFVTGLVIYWSTFFLLIAFTGIRTPTITLDFILVVALVVMACSALSAIVALLVQNSALKALLFPLIFLPLLFVLIFIAVELSSNLLLDGSFTWNNPLVAILIAANVIYILAGINLIDIALKR